jgi:hypothetical protein
MAGDAPGPAKGALRSCRNGGGGCSAAASFASQLRGSHPGSTRRGEAPSHKARPIPQASDPASFRIIPKMFHVKHFRPIGAQNLTRCRTAFSSSTLSDWSIFWCNWNRARPPPQCSGAVPEVFAFVRCARSRKDRRARFVGGLTTDIILLSSQPLNRGSGGCSRSLAGL